ncbi:MAG: hypothetical protein ACFFDH_03355 [Promethearchaeota archaeon]
MHQNQNKSKKSEDISPSKPINYIELIEDLIRVNKLDYATDLVKQITMDGLRFPLIRFELKYLCGEKIYEPLLERFRKTPEIFLEDVKEALIKRAKFEEPKIYDYFKNEGNNSSVEIHIIPDRKGAEWLVPTVENLSLDLTPFRDKIILYRGKFQSIGLERVVEFRKLHWRCNWCGQEFDTLVTYRQTTEKYKWPDFCINKRCKAKKKSAFDLIQTKCETYEKRRFDSIDIESRYLMNEINCYISVNSPYFIEKAQDLHTNDELEILGILKLDTAELLSQKEIQIPQYFIDVIEFTTTRNMNIDQEIVKQIKKEIKKDKNYILKIIDSIHPYSQGIFNFLITKIVLNIAWSTSDSYRNDLRNGINSIIGGHAGTLKSHQAKAFSKIIGFVNFGIIEGTNTTGKGLVPTIQRSSKEKDLITRNGIIAMWNKKVLVLDEAHYLYLKDNEALKNTKCYESGLITRAADGTPIIADAKGTLVFLVNYQTETEAFDYYLDEDRIKNILKNLAFPNDKSILDRFDLHYRVPIINNNIVEILNKRDSKSYIPKYQIDEEIIKNYLLEQKKIYSNGIDIPKEIHVAINQLYREVLANEGSKVRRIRNSREVRIIKNVIKSIAAMFLRDTVIDEDLEFLKKYLINTVIPFQDNKYIIESRIINTDEFFRNVFDLLTELHEETFNITQFIKFLREYLKENFFPKWEQEGELNNLIGEEGKEALRNNKRFEDLLKNNKDYIENSGWIIEIIHNKTCFVNKERLYNKIKDKILEIKEVNHSIPLKIENIVPIIELEFECSKELIMKVIKLLVKNQVFEIDENNKLK